VTAAAAPGEAGTGGVRAVLELAGYLVAPTTAVPALLYYFGWVRTGAVFGYFGVDQSTLQMSTVDYLLRSAEVAFRPLAALLLVLAGWVWLHSMIRRRDRGPARRRLRAALPGCAAATIALPLVDLFVHPLAFLPPLTAAMLLGVGALLADLALRSGPPSRTGARRAAHLLLGGAVVIAVFWSTAVYADISGRALATAIAAHPTSRPGVIAYCQQRPLLTGHGITVTAVPGPDSPYRYRYDGLVLLIHTGSVWLLLPAAWAPDDPVIRLPDTAACRLDFRTPR
jgi:hypothetical protein